MTKGAVPVLRRGVFRKMSQQERRLALETREKLVALFPNCFCGKGEQKKPLKLRIHKDIFRRAPELDKHAVELALSDYTGGVLYLRGIISSDTRVDLDGQPAGFVSTEAAADAARRLNIITEHNAKAAERKARRIEKRAA